MANPYIFITALKMWLVVVALPLLPAIIMASGRYHSLFRQAVAWTLRMVRGKVCVKSIHSFVFTHCTHGKVDSVLETFDLYADTHPTLCISPQMGQYTHQNQFCQVFKVEFLRVKSLNLTSVQR